MNTRNVNTHDKHRSDYVAAGWVVADIERPMTKPVHTPPYLTQEQVNALPSGTEIVVTWSSGNGPAEYMVGKCAWTGKSSAWFVSKVSIDLNPIFVSVLDFVGDKKPHTRVPLAVPA